MNIEGLVNTQSLHLKCIVGDEQLNQCVSQQVILYHSYQFVTGITDGVTQSRISVQRQEAAAPDQ